MGPAGLAQLACGLLRGMLGRRGLGWGSTPERVGRQARDTRHVAGPTPRCSWGVQGAHANRSRSSNPTCRPHPLPELSQLPGAWGSVCLGLEGLSQTSRRQKSGLREGPAVPGRATCTRPPPEVTYSSRGSQLRVALARGIQTDIFTLASLLAGLLTLGETGREGRRWAGPLATPARRGPCGPKKDAPSQGKKGQKPRALLSREAPPWGQGTKLLWLPLGSC